jgi:hypothetical protein
VDQAEAARSYARTVLNTAPALSPAVAASYGLQVSGHCAPHLHAHAAAAIPNLRDLEWFHDHVRIESLLFDCTLSPAGGAIRPDPAAPGLGLVIKAVDAERYRVG